MSRTGVASGRGWTMYLGDCTEVLARLDKVDHVITDPPYEAESHTKLRRSCVWPSLNGRGARAFRDAPLSFPPITEEERSRCGYEFARLARRWILVFAQFEGVPAWRARLVGAGAKHRRAMVWIKPDATPQFTGDRPGSGYEMIYVAHARGKGRSRWNGGGRRGVFVHTAHTKSRGRGSDGEEHETKKPQALMRELVDLFTDPGEVVLDAFAGSGQTGIACVAMGRRFIGIERDEKWFDRACESLYAASMGTTVQAQRAGQRTMFA